MSITYGGQKAVTAQEVAFSIYTAVDSAFFDVEYPEQDWYKVLKDDQIISNINAGAQNYGFITRDRQGSAAFIGQAENNNIPMVSQSIGAVTVPLAASAVGAKINNEDARQWQFGFNGNLAQELGEIMRVACDNLIETSTMFGDSSVGFQGFINYPGVVISNAMPSESVPASTKWKDKTAQEMIKDVQSSIRAVYLRTRTVMLPNVVFLPPEQFSMLNDTPFTLGTGGATAAFSSALDYLKRNNLYTQLRGQELEIVPIRYLQGAGVDGVNRMVVQDRSAKNQAMPFPLPYQVQAPVPVPLGAEFYSEQKHGSYAMRQPAATMYVDGI